MPTAYNKNLPLRQAGGEFSAETRDLCIFRKLKV